MKTYDLYLLSLAPPGVQGILQCACPPAAEEVRSILSAAKEEGD